MARHLADAAPINLLQGAYASKSRLQATGSDGGLRRSSSPTSIGLNLVAKGVQPGGWQDRATLDTAIEQTFREAMPGEQNTANARRRMQARFDELQRGGGGGDGSLLKVLNAIGTAVAQAGASIIAYQLPRHWCST